MSIELIVLDVDGTMTDSRISYSESGDEVKSFNVKDGLGIVSWMRLGKKVAIITGRSSKIVQKRAKELHVEYCYQGIKDKSKVLSELLEKLNLDYENTAAIGDDLNDYTMLQDVAISFVPKDATPAVERIATVALSKKGGDGAVREMIDYLIEKEGLVDELHKIWSVD
ncbi:MAG: HAD-IIIA family hydrolase [Sulfurovum sp.]|nr:HAD-IIIA family hydrolase [Sulfurovum sp.]